MELKLDCYVIPEELEVNTGVAIRLRAYYTTQGEELDWEFFKDEIDRIDLYFTYSKME